MNDNLNHQLDEENAEQDECAAHQKYLEMFWFPDRDRAVPGLMSEAKEPPGVLRCIVRVTRSEDSTDFAGVVKGQCGALKQNSPGVRRVAANLLQRAFDALDDGILSRLPEELDVAIPALIDATEDQTEAVQLAVLEVLKFAVARTQAAPIVRAIARNTLTSRNLHIVNASLDVLESAGIDAASVAAPALAALLSKSTGEVGSRVCRLLASCEEDAAQAVPALVEIATGDLTPSLRPEAVRAIIKIDPDGDVVPQLLMSDDRLGQLLELLRGLGEEGRRLRRALQRKTGDAGQTSTLGSQQSPVNRTRTDDTRDQWIYQRACDKVQYKDIIRELKAKASELNQSHAETRSSLAQSCEFAGVSQPTNSGFQRDFGLGIKVSLPGDSSSTRPVAGLPRDPAWRSGWSAAPDRTSAPRPGNPPPCG